MLWVFSLLISGSFWSQYCHSEDDVEIHQCGAFPEIIAHFSNTNIKAKKARIVTQNSAVIITCFIIEWLGKTMSQIVSSLVVGANDLAAQCQVDSPRTIQGYNF